MTNDERDAAVAAVAARYPDLTGDAFDRKVARVAALMRYANDGPTWTAGRGKVST